MTGCVLCRVSCGGRANLRALRMLFGTTKLRKHLRTYLLSYSSSCSVLDQILPFRVTLTKGVLCPLSSTSSRSKPVSVRNGLCNDSVADNSLWGGVSELLEDLRGMIKTVAHVESRK